MLVEFGTSCLPAHHLYLGYGKKGTLSPAAYTVGLFEGDARKCADIYGERTLVERGKETAAEAEEEEQRDDQYHKCGAKHHARMTKCPAQRTGVAVLQIAGDKGLALDMRGVGTAAKQETAQYGGERKSHHSG